MKCAWVWCPAEAEAGHWCAKHEARLGDTDVEAERVEDQ